MKKVSVTDEGLEILRGEVDRLPGKGYTNAVSGR
jgi:hypothetical protein